MAELNDRVEKFAAATLTITLSQSLRLARNFKYYRQQKTETFYRKDLLKRVKHLSTLGFVLQHLISGDERDENIPFIVSTAGQIHDLFEQIHRSLLFFEAKDIESIIPVIDNERKFWKARHQTDFYSDDLTYRLDHEFPECIRLLEHQIQELPESVTL